MAKEVKRTPKDKTRPPQTAAKRVDLRRQNAITRGDKTKEKLKPKAARQPEKNKRCLYVKNGDSNCHHIVWKLLKMSHLKFLLLAFSNNFWPIKTDLSGNFRLKKKWTIFGT